MATYSNAVKKVYQIYFSKLGTILETFGDTHFNAQDDEVAVIKAFIEDGVVDNVTTLVNFTPEGRTAFTSHWFPMFYRGLQEKIVSGEAEPRTFAQFEITLPSIVLLMNGGKTSVSQSMTVIQRYGSIHLGNFATITDLNTDNPASETYFDDSVVAFVYSNEAGQTDQVGFYQVEEVEEVWTWVLKTTLLYALSTKQYNGATFTVGRGPSNPQGVPTVSQSLVYQLMQEISYLDIVYQSLDVDMTDLQDKVEALRDGSLPIEFNKNGTNLTSTQLDLAIKEVNVKTNTNENDITNIENGTTPIFFDKTGTDLDAGFIEEAIKEVNVETNANKQNIEKIVDGTTIVKKAEQDKNGNDIVTTYETKSDATSKLSLKADKTYVDSQDQALDDKIYLLDERVEDLEIANMIKSYTYNPTTHVITFTYYDNTTTSFDLPLESAIVSASYDDTTQDITFVLQSGATLVVPLDDIVSGLASETWVTTYFIPKTSIVDNVTTDDATKVLSAKQGKVLKDTVDLLDTRVDDLDAHNIRFNGSGTNYLVNKLDVESAVKELDTQVAELGGSLVELENLQYKIRNEVENGNFAVDTNLDGLADGWSAQGTITNCSIIDGIQSFTPTQYGQLKHPISLKLGHKYYIQANILATNASVLLSVYTGTKVVFRKNVPTYNHFRTISGIIVVEEELPTAKIYIEDIGIVNGEVKVSSVNVIDITEDFGVNNEPSMIAMRSLIDSQGGYINGLISIKQSDNFNWLSSSLLEQSLNVPEMMYSIDINEAIASPSQKKLNIQNYVNITNEIVHPSVLFFANGWNGYRYWMGYTPYDNNNSDYENPSLAVSNDNITWNTPSGLVNPVEPIPDYPGGYNADICLVMSPDNKTMYMIWKRVVANKQTCIRSSIDGINWTPREVLFENEFEDVSPSVLWDGNQYKMWTIKHEDTPNKLYLRTANIDMKEWSNPILCPVGIPSEMEMWHLEVRKLGSQYHILISSLGGFGDLYFGSSNDGINWSIAKQPLFLSLPSLYKSSMLPIMSNDGLRYGLWYGTNAPNYIHYTEIRFERSKKINESNNDILYAKNGLSSWLFCDTFNRANTINGLGISDSGQTWVNVLGSDMGIFNQAAYLYIAENCRTVVDLGVSNYYAEVEMANVAGVNSGYMLFRFIDNNNLWRIGYNANVILLNRIVNGVNTVFTIDERISNKDRIAVSCLGNEISIFKNGQKIYTLTDSANVLGTKIGLQADNTTARFKNIIAKSL